MKFCNSYLIRLRGLGAYRCHSGHAMVVRTPVQHDMSPHSPLVQIRNKFPERSHLMSIIWRQRSSPNILSTFDLKAIRSQSNKAVMGDKHMSDSFVEVLLPFKHDAKLQAEYVSIHGGLRFGKVMEDLDALAASIAYLYCDDTNLTLVTAAVDRIDLLKGFDKIADLRLRGFVTYIGRSSMEITMAVELNENDHNWELGALAKFLFVARSSDGKSAVPVPRLILETEGEKELFNLGQARHQYRLRRNENSLFRQPPTEAESQLLHRLLMSPPIDSTPMKHTQKYSIKICHPQERNIHNFIFGGHLMREAFELAYTTAVMFTKGKPTFITTVDDITFVHPVAIGSMLNFCAHVVYTDIDPFDPNLGRLHVEVIADVVDPLAETRVTTNTFHFTFASPTTTPKVIPETYTEAMKYLEGKRRMELNDAR